MDAPVARIPAVAILCLPAATTVAVVGIISVACMTRIAITAVAIVIMILCPSSAIMVPAVSVMGLSVTPAIGATMTPVIAITITIVMHSVAIMPRSRTAVTTWTPEISVPVAVARVPVAVINVVVAENTEARSPVIMVIVIMMPVVRVTPVAVVIYVQMISHPANGERRRYTPEKV